MHEAHEKLDGLERQLGHHEEKSESRFHNLKDAIKHGREYGHHEKDYDMVKDEVHVHNDSAGGGLGALAAMGNMGRGFDGAGAAWGVGGLVLGTLLGGNRGCGGGLFGGGGNCGGGDASVAGLFAVENKLGNIQQEIAQTAACTTQAITNLSYQGALANCQNFGELKMQIAQGNAAIIANQDQGTFKILSAMNEIERNNLTAKTIEQNARIVALENEQRYGRNHAELREQITITNNNAASANAIAVARQDESWRQNLLCTVQHVHQEARATNQNIIAGNTGAVTTAAQTANPTNVSV